MTPTKWVNLYNKYRPTCFDEVVGQKPVIRTLRNAVSRNRVAHAYLFRGSRGSGKTSTARILCRTTNCLTGVACLQCDGCSGAMRDVFELDAASNRGIDDITELIETLQFRPKFVDKRFVIIDEAHQLTSAAVNALLKIVEEPPAHIYFIFCTTEPIKYWDDYSNQLTEAEKAFDILASRCQSFIFTKVGYADILKKLRYICESEGRDVSEDVLRGIVGRSEGSVRDAENFLEQVLLWDDEDLADNIIRLLYGDVVFLAAEYFRECCIGTVTDGLNAAHNIWENGGSPKEIATLCLDFVSSVIQLKTGCEVYCPSDIVSVLEEISENVERNRLEAVAVAFGSLRSSNNDSLLGLELAVCDSADVTTSEVRVEEEPEIELEEVIPDAKIW